MIACNALACRPLQYALALLLIHACPVAAQQVMPERFALLEQQQVAFLCSYALLKEAADAVRVEDVSKTLVDNAVMHIAASRAWRREAVNVEPGSAKRWQVAFDGQGKTPRTAQLDYCYGAGIAKLQSMAEAEGSIIVAGARDTVRKLYEGRERYGR